MAPFDWVRVVALLVLSLLGASALVRWGTRWGSRPADRVRRLPGDDYLDGHARARVAMTRAISLGSPPAVVWPWIAQLGRGAGWYSVDRLDNGGRTSARHLVSWIPEPRIGDASAIGYLRHLEPGRSLAWWSGGATFVGASVRLTTCYVLDPEGDGTRLIGRMSADANGATAHLALGVFRVVDSIMAVQQLRGLRARVEQNEDARASSRAKESGRRDQYQLYEMIYANGERAGVPGEEAGAREREAAIRDGVPADEA